MKIIYRNKVVEKHCTNYKEAQKVYNKIVAEKIHSVINFIENANNLMEVKNMPMYKLHPLHGDRKGEYAIDLGRKIGYRLIIIPLDENHKEWNISDLVTIYKNTYIIKIEEVSKHYE